MTELIPLLDELRRIERDEDKLLVEFHRLADQAEDSTNMTERANLLERARAVYAASPVDYLGTDHRKRPGRPSAY
jgi:hypothetical protein